MNFDETVKLGQKNRLLYSVGGSFLGFGLGATLAGSICYSISEKAEYYIYCGLGLSVVGGIIMLCSIPSSKQLKISSTKLLNSYNSGVEGQQYSMNIDFGATSSGGVGVTLSF